MSNTFKEESRKSWVPSSEMPITTEQIGIGCLQRIADATELMSSNFVKLQNDYEYMKKSRDSYRNDLEGAQRKITAYKGVITKLNNKIKNTNGLY